MTVLRENITEQINELKREIDSLKKEGKDFFSYEKKLKELSRQLAEANDEKQILKG